MIRCSQCNTVQLVPGSAFCSRCGAAISVSSDKTGLLNPRQFVWETVLNSNTPLQVFVAAVSESLLHPDRFYGKVVSDAGKTLPALLFGLITGGIGLTASSLWAVFGLRAKHFFSMETVFPLSRVVSASSLATAPILLLTQLGLTGLYVFLIMRLSNLRHPSFSSLFRLICYAEAPMLLQAVPVIGSVVAPFVWFYTLLTGLRHLYRSSRIKILFHLLLPFLLCSLFVVIILLAGVLGGIIAGSNHLPDLKFLLDYF